MQICVLELNLPPTDLPFSRLPSMGWSTPQSMRIANVRRQLRTGMTRGANPRALEPSERDALEAEEAAYKVKVKNRVVTRLVEAVGEAAVDIKNHTAETVEASTAGVKRAFVETFCPQPQPGASTKEQLDAYKTRHRGELTVVAALRKKLAEEKAKPKPKRAAAKKAASAGGSASAGSAAKVLPPAGKKRLCGALCMGAKQKPGKPCRKPFPCRFHPEVAAAPANAEEVEPAAVEIAEIAPAAAEIAEIEPAAVEIAGDALSDDESRAELVEETGAGLRGFPT